MNVIAVDDERLALDTLVDSVEKALPEANVYGFSKPKKRWNSFRKAERTLPFSI